jgi:hypothetical protein
MAVGAELCAEIEAEASDRCADEPSECFTVGCYESLPPFGACEPDGLALVDRRAIRRAGSECEAGGWRMTTQEARWRCEGEDAPPAEVELKVSCAPEYML